MKELGRGGQGYVGMYRETETNEYFAVKLDTQAMFSQGALAEGRFFANVGKDLKRAPKYYQHLSQDYKYYMIMELLDETAQEYLDKKKAEGAFDQTIKSLAQQMLDAI